ncbi:MAG: hypothetical protein CEN87_280 [Parcubacteria group bacterium Licking1014_1]|nr:MAG: hypothetical protein CEN87_280 [Parcubacteria group bacterium Licking1014_1]
MKERGFIKYIIAIVVVLAVVFFSQQPYFREYGKNLYNQVVIQGQFWWQAAYHYAQQNIFPKIGGEVEKRKEIIQGELEQEKNKISENIWKKIKKYFADIIFRILNPSGSGNSGQTAPNTASDNLLPSQSPFDQ